MSTQISLTRRTAMKAGAALVVALGAKEVLFDNVNAAASTAPAVAPEAKVNAAASGPAARQVLIGLL